MPTYLLSFALYWMASVNYQPKTIQTPDAIQVSGICLDATTATYLPIEAFTMSGTTKIVLGLSDKDGKFYFQLPLSATSISFASNDYHTVTLPVSFVNKPGSKAEFRLGIIMSKRDSVAIQQTNQLIVSNDLPNNVAVNYTVEPIGSNAGLPLLTTAHGNRVVPGGSFKIEKGRGLPRINFEGARPGPYRVAASMANGQVLVDKRFTVKEGLTFMEVRVDEPNLSLPAGSVKEDNRAVTTMPSSKIVYFEQSRYELNPDVKASLDSVAQVLLDQQQLIARITGYTDNVGEQKLNLTLSEYRAKMVANYLQRKGVQGWQLHTAWKGSSSLTVLGESEAEKSKNRRVVIEFERK